MRYTAKTAKDVDDSGVKRVMIHQVEDGSALLYVYESQYDGGCNGDYWFQTVEDAAECAFEDYGVIPENINFGVKASVVKNFLESNSVELKNRVRNIFLAVFSG